MVKGPGKLGRGAGSAGKHSIHASSIKRPSPAAPSSRLSLSGGSRGRGGASSSAGVVQPTSPQLEESFSLVRESVLNFAMAIKLVPELVEEIKRAEAQGYVARVKFDANPNNANGNVINVGTKNFKFTWATESGHLCDIYEERQCGEDGNRLLVESGSAWRKLNVERVLDESTQNQVKMRSEEAERRQKSRKAIVLDHQNLSGKNQGKGLAAVESSSWRNFKHKKEPPSRKLKSETTPVGPPKSAYISGLSATPSKVKKSSVSPLSSQVNQCGNPASPFETSNLVKGHVNVLDIASSGNKVDISDKDLHTRLQGGTSDKLKHSHNMDTKSSDLRSMMISLLQEHHSKGMSLKALEKAVGDAMPDAKNIEPILKQIAIFQAPGRYVLKPGMGLDSFRDPPSNRGSSPQIVCNPSPSLLTIDDMSAEAPNFSMRTALSDQEQAQLTSTPGCPDTLEIVDILNNSPDHFTDGIAFDINGVAPAGSSSGNGSDSESDSDSGSDSGSHKSKSRDGSSSDSESDSSSSSKQASDEDVDIMTSDDEKEPKHMLQDSERISLGSPAQLRGPDSEIVDIGNYEQDNHASDIVEIEKDSPEDNHGILTTAVNHRIQTQDQEPVEEVKQTSSCNDEHQSTQDHDRKLYGQRDNGFKPGESGSHERLSKSKSKRRSDDLPHNSKRSKGKTSNQLVSGTINQLFGENTNNYSPDRALQSPFARSIDQTTAKASRNGNNDRSSLTGLNQGVPTRSASDSRQLDNRFLDPSEPESTSRGVRPSERSFQTNEGLRTKKGMNMGSNNENGLRKPVKEAGPHSFPDAGFLPTEHNVITDKSPVVNGRVRVLRREPSELELGEFREPLSDANPGQVNQFERKTSSKLPQKEPDLEFCNSDLNRGKPPNKMVASDIADEFSKRKVPETSKKGQVSVTEQHQGVVPRTTKESKKQKSKKITDSVRQKDSSLTGSIDGGHKRKQSSSDETSCPYAKYNKEMPELKGPIKDISQYKEYVNEYQEKYESYCSLNKVLESYRDEFNNLGKNLESFRGRDTRKYNEILGQIRSSFRQCGEKHKRLKKIYVVLHEELKNLKQMIKDYATLYTKN